MTTKATEIDTQKMSLDRFTKPAIFIAGMLLVLCISGWTSTTMLHKFGMNLVSLCKAVNYALFLLVMPLGTFLFFTKKNDCIVKPSAKLDKHAKTEVVLFAVAAIISITAIAAMLIYIANSAAKNVLNNIVSTTILDVMLLLFPVAAICICLLQVVQCMNISKLGVSALPLFILNGCMLGLNATMYRLWADLDATAIGAAPYIYGGFAEIFVFAGVSIIVACVAMAVIYKSMKKVKVSA